MGSQPVYDVIVVGSGAAGGVAAYVLASKGLNVLCLEAGRPVDPAVDFKPHKMPYQWPYRGLGKPNQYGKLPRGMEWKITEWTDQLYTIPQEDPYAVAPGSKFTWTRMRLVGGRTNVWGRNCERFGPLDFKAKSRQDGFGEDWPIDYDDIATYYDHVERLIGVSGISEGAYNAPCGKYLLPAFKARCGEWLIKRGAEKLDIKVLPLQLAVLSQDYDGRPQCHYCGACDHGCDTASRFSSPDVLVPKLAKLSNFTLRTHAVVNSVLLDRNTGKARGVTYIDANHRQQYEAYGKSVVLGASMVESIRILLNSRTREFPNGLANSSGVLGKYVFDQVSFNPVTGFFPQLAGRPTTNDDGPGEASLYIPRYNYGERNSKKFLRGYRLFFHTGCSIGPGVGATLPGFGRAFKKRIKELYPANAYMRGMGEGLAFASNYIAIDPDGLTDRYGIPQVRFHTTSEYDNAFAMRDEMYGEMERIMKAAGVEVLPYPKMAPFPLGSITHESGGARMGDDPKNSVLDAWNRCHDVKNLLVVDAGAFVTLPEKHPTLTIMALAYRAADHLAEEMRTGNV